MSEPHSPATIVDGNAVAGMLSTVVRADPTFIELTCAQCGSRGALAETIVELCPDSAVVRCRACTRTLLTLVPTADHLMVRVGGLDIALPSA